MSFSHFNNLADEVARFVKIKEARWGQGDELPSKVLATQAQGPDTDKDHTDKDTDSPLT